MALCTTPLKQIPITAWLLILIINCDNVFAQAKTELHKLVDTFPPNTGDIAFNATLDDPSFTVCNPQIVLQYYNTASYYKEHKREIEHYFKSNYHPGTEREDQSGYLTIRFIINCSGQTGRFRMYELDTGYKPFTFHSAISDQLMKLTKNLQGWQPATYKGKIYDSYQYITFRLKKGAIECISP